MDDEYQSSRILIVDDVYRNIQLAGAILKQENFHFSFATDGNTALRVAREGGVDLILLDIMLELRASNNDVVEPYAAKFGAKFFPGKRPWDVPVDIAVPCAIQNELHGDDADKLMANGVKFVVETSNMGCTAEAVEKFLAAKVPFVPGKAANAGGVAVSGLEMSQNSMGKIVSLNSSTTFVLWRKAFKFTVFRMSLKSLCPRRESDE